MRLTGRTDFLVRVVDADEAHLALDAGADRLAVSANTGPPGIARVRDIVQAARGRAPVSASLSILPILEPHDAMRTLAQCGVDAIIIDAGTAAAGLLTAAREQSAAVRGAAAFRVAPDGALPDIAVLGALAENGFRMAILERAVRPAPRLIERPGIEALSRFVEAAQRRGLEAGLSGGLEAPDVPRMLALQPNVLAFRTSLCFDDAPDKPLDPARVAMMRALIPRNMRTEAGRAHRPEERSVSPGTPDKVFVRDFIVEAGIGAYRYEHRRTQRMRFNVEADLLPIPDSVADMRDVFSYDVIVDAIRLATRRHVLLVEKVALDVAHATLRDPRVKRVRVRVEKLDILDGAVGVEIERGATR